MKLHQNGMLLMWLDHTLKVWELLSRNVTGQDIKLSVHLNPSVHVRYSRDIMGKRMNAIHEHEPLISPTMFDFI